jgi:hypothetical protein
MMLPQILEEYSKDEMYGRAWKRVEMRRRDIQRFFTFMDFCFV